MQVLMDDMADHLAQTVKQCGDFKDVVSGGCHAGSSHPVGGGGGGGVCVRTYVYVVCGMHRRVCRWVYTDQRLSASSQLSDKELAYNLTVALERMAELSR